MTTPIIIENSVSDEKMQAIKALVKQEARENPAFESEEFDIQRGEHTSVEGNGYDHVELLDKIMAIINTDD